MIVAEPLEIQLANGRKIVSGWSDEDDPEALPAGDWLSVEDEKGEQVFYVEAADLLDDLSEGRFLLYQFLVACRGK